MTRQSAFEPWVVTVVGGGASAHVLIPFLAAAGHRVQLLTRKPDQWSSRVTLELEIERRRDRADVRGVAGESHRPSPAR